MREGRPAISTLIGSWLALAGACFLVDFVHVRQFGLLVDDWTLMGDLLFNETRSPWVFIGDLFRASWEGRPLRALEHMILLGGYRLLGVPGAFLTQWVVLSLNAIVLTHLVARRWPWHLAFATGLIFVLHPADTTHAWAANFMAKLGFLYMITGCWLFARGRVVVPALLCLASLLSYELSVFPFILAPWFADGVTRRSLVRFVKVVAIVLGAYSAWRFLVFPRLVVSDDPRMWVVLEGMDRDGLLAWARTFPEALRLAFVHWPQRAWSLATEAELRVMTIAGGCLTGGLALLALQRVPVTTRPRPGALLTALVFGGLAVMSASCLGFFSPPTPRLGTESRVNYMFTPGAAIVLVGTWMLLARLSGERLPSWLGALALAVIVAVAGGARYRVQKDHVDAAQQQHEVLRAAIGTLGPLPPHTIVGLIHVPKPAFDERANRPFLTGWNWDMERCFQMVYDETISAIALADAQDYMRVVGGDVDEENLEKVRERIKDKSIVFYFVDTKKVEWLQRRPDAATATPVPPAGRARDFIFR